MKSVLDMCKVLADRPVVLLLRFAPVAQTGPTQGEKDSRRLTPEGQEQARAFGQHVGAWLKCIHTSPYLRCQETANAIIAGAGVDHVAVDDWRLGNPSVFIDPGHVKEAEKVFYDRGHDWIVEELMQDREVPGWVNPPSDAARELIQYTCEVAERQGPGLSVFVTLDLVILVTLALVFDLHVPRQEWPGYLEGALIFPDKDRLVADYRGRKAHCNWPLRLPLL